MTDELKLANGTIHGAAGALKRIRQGKEFVGLAKVAQDSVLDRLEVDGIEGEMMRNAVKLQVTADLYWPVYVKMLEEGDYVRATEYLAKFTYLTAKAQLAWEKAYKMKPMNDNRDYVELLAKYRMPAKSPQEGENAPDN